MSRRIAIAGVMLASIACTPESVQTDALRPRIPQECQTEQGCAALRIEALRQQAMCHPDAQPQNGPRCADTQFDLNDISTRVAQFAAARKEQERIEQQAKREEQRLQREEANRKRQDESIERRRASSLRLAYTHCEQYAARFECAKVEGLEGAAMTQCNSECFMRSQATVEKAYQQAVRNCVTSVVSAVGSWSPDCRFTLPHNTTENLDSRHDECVAACTEQAKPMLERANTGAPPPPMPSPIPAASTSAAKP